MGATQPVYSSVSGPAKWAAVVALAAACGAGLTYGMIGRGAKPAAAAPAPVVDHGTRARGTSGSRVAGGAPAIAPQPQTVAMPAVAPPATSAPVPVQTPVTPPAAPSPAPVSTPLLSPATSPGSTPPGPSVPAPLSPAPGEVHNGKLINVNTAGMAELELLPRVGPAMAQRIIDYRVAHGPFRSLADLDKVKGIGPKTLEKLAPLITLE